MILIGKYYGIKTISKSSKIFNINWELNSPITLPSTGKYNLRFYLYYNCYETKGLLGFFSTDCATVKDRLTIYTKTINSGSYDILKQYLFDKSSSINKWNEYNIDLDLDSTSLYVI
jgi:hypothetical protein